MNRLEPCALQADRRSSYRRRSRCNRFPLPNCLRVHSGELISVPGFPIRSLLFDANHPAFLYGWLMAAWGVGRLGSAAVTPRVLERLEWRRQPLEPYFIALLIVTFACFLGVFEVRAMAGMLGFALPAGIFDAATETVYYSLLQSTPTASHDRVIGVPYVAERARPAA